MNIWKDKSDREGRLSGASALLSSDATRTVWEDNKFLTLTAHTARLHHPCCQIWDFQKSKGNLPNTANQLSKESKSDIGKAKKWFLLKKDYYQKKTELISNQEIKSTVRAKIAKNCWQNVGLGWEDESISPNICQQGEERKLFHDGPSKFNSSQKKTESSSNEESKSTEK